MGFIWWLRAGQNKYSRTEGPEKEQFKKIILELMEAGATTRIQQSPEAKYFFTTILKDALEKDHNRELITILKRPTRAWFSCAHRR